MADIFGPEFASTYDAWEFFLTISSCWDGLKPVDFNNFVASCQQAGNRQCEHILSWWNSIGTCFLQVVRFYDIKVTSCGCLRSRVKVCAN